MTSLTASVALVKRATGCPDDDLLLVLRVMRNGAPSGWLSTLGPADVEQSARLAWDALQDPEFRRAYES